MLDRFAPLLKIICLALAAMLLLQIVRLLAHSDPLGRAAIPPLPKLSVEAEAKTVVTNSAPKKKAGDTNAITQVKAPKHGSNFGPHFGGPKTAVTLPPPIQTRVDRIKESEILGPFIRPQPMALLGIADDNVFLRAPNGQTGMIKEGGEVGGIKLLRIDINRVLVEEDGEKKELTLFEGFGSESLLPKGTNSSTNSIPEPDQKENP